MRFLFPLLVWRVTRKPCSRFAHFLFVSLLLFCLYFARHIVLIYSFLLLLLFYSHPFPHFFFGFLDFANRHYNSTSQQRRSLEGFVTNLRAHINKQPLHYQEGACNHPQCSVTQDSSSHWFYKHPYTLAEGEARAENTQDALLDLSRWGASFINVLTITFFKQPCMLVVIGQGRMTQITLP